MQTYSVVKHEVENATINFSFNQVTVTDSKSRDSVAIEGVSRKQLTRELRYWVSGLRWSHYRTAQDRDDILSELRLMQETVAQTLESMEPKKAETSK